MFALPRAWIASATDAITTLRGGAGCLLGYTLRCHRMHVNRPKPSGSDATRASRTPSCAGLKARVLVFRRAGTSLVKKTVAKGRHALEAAARDIA